MKKCLLIVGAFLLLGSTTLGASVELNVVPSARAPFNAAQDWMRALANLKSVRVRSSNNQRTARPEVKRGGSTVHITAIVDANNRLVVPGNKFSIRQTSALQNWLDQQREGSAVVVAKDRFGVTGAQLREAHEALKRVVTESTRDKRVDQIVASIAKQTGLPLQVSTVARTQWNHTTVSVEWQGFSSGTVIAAVLRPLELVLVPKADESGRLALLITSETSVPEGWPVGWKSTLKKRELVPKIYDPLPIDVNETPIADVVAAIGARLETPMMYDMALLDLMKIDPSTVKITYNSERTIYMKAISQSLFKAKMKYELRVDERGKPFFWILPRRTLKPIPR